VKPVLTVLAGVNGAGKSSVGGFLLRRAGLTWFNPDTYARELMASTGCTQARANAAAWECSRSLLERAIERAENYAFETTLGGTTIKDMLVAATSTHDVEVWFCGLTSPEFHIARVQARVARGGHDIPEAKIRERFDSSRLNLIELMPRLNYLSVYDNSATARPGASVQDPRLLLTMERGRLLYPDTNDLAALEAVPEWARPIAAKAIELQRSRRATRRR
jgi:predicted ABC-type ATPase